MTAVWMPNAQINAICVALMSLPASSDAATRTIYLQEVEGEIGKQISVARHNDARYDLRAIVRACEQEPGGLQALLEIVAHLHPGAAAVTTAKQTFAAWTLAALLPTVSVDVLAEAITSVAGGVVAANTDVALLESIGWQPATVWGVPAMIAFADLIRAGFDDGAEQFEHWLTSTAHALGLTGDDLDRLHRVTAAHWALVRSRDVADGVDTDGEDNELDVRRTIIIEDRPTSSARTLIRGGIPPRNLFFTGRADILTSLERILASQSLASVLPEAGIHGFGGVGKTQVAVEFTYRYASRYQLIWWIAAEDLATVRSSLAALAERLGLPPNNNMEQTIRAVLDALSTSPLSWLVVYDNADDPAQLAALMPSANVVGERGHVLVTTRNTAWSANGRTLEVDVFNRAESLELLRKRIPSISSNEADRLAEKLGDLPLALEQATSWLLTMLSSVDEYLAEFDKHARQLMAEGQPRQYQGTVLTVVSMALPKLREQAPAAAQLLDLLVFLAPEPIPTRLLWEGRRADATEPLRTALQERNDVARAVRQLGSFGLAKIDSGNRRVQIHRLVQVVLREGLIEEEDNEGLCNARRLLAAANPGFPDERSTWPRHADIAPHVRVAGLIYGDIDERRTVLDQLRYMYNLGDFESCRDFAEEILAVWDQPGEDGAESSDPLTLLALRRYADALRGLGDPRAAEQGLRALERMRVSLGEEHEYTLGAANSVGADLRRAGEFEAAAALDESNLEVHRRVLGAADPSTLRVMNSVAINRRLAGDFAGAYAINLEVERQARTALDDGAYATVLAQEAQARDLYLLGRYADALDLLDGSLPQQKALLGDSHLTVLRATCIHTACLRKTGRLVEASKEGLANYLSVTRRFGTDHVMAGETAMACANALRAAGDAAQAYTFAVRGHALFTGIFGERHAITLCAGVNLGVILRARGFDREARELGEKVLRLMRDTLPETHPYLLSARSAQGINLVRAHRLPEAQEMSYQILLDSRRIRGPQHPYTLYCMTNAAVDLIEIGDEVTGLPLLAEAAGALEAAFGPDHPEVESARGQRRIECDIETVGLA